MYGAQSDGLTKTQWCLAGSGGVNVWFSGRQVKRGPLPLGLAPSAAMGLLLGCLGACGRGGWRGWRGQSHQVFFRFGTLVKNGF